MKIRGSNWIALIGIHIVYHTKAEILYLILLNYYKDACRNAILILLKYFKMRAMR